jgi:DNA-binding GntR family transcriptional regulator
MKKSGRRTVVEAANAARRIAKPRSKPRGLAMDGKSAPAAVDKTSGHLKKAANLGDTVYQNLKQLIIACEIRPGEDISETRLAARLKVGKAPIRFALARLRQEGLVRSHARSGHVVSSLTMQDVLNVYELRLILEPLAARRAASQITGEALNELDRLCSTFYQPGDRASENQFLTANRAFHMIIARSSGNERLAALVELLHDEAARILSLCISHRPTDWDSAHREIVDALRRHDGATAEAVQRRELEKSRDAVRNALFDGIGLLNINLGAAFAAAPVKSG